MSSTRSFAHSERLYSEAEKVIPGGVNSPARSWGGVGGTPIYFEKAAGSHVWDVDGNKYVDYVGSWGPMVLGHAHPDVLGAIKRVVDSGTSFGAPTESETKIAKIIVDAFTSIDKVRFVNSGTEATMSALRLARAFTNRSKIVKFQGGYHGHTDALLVAAGSGALAHGVPDSAGVTDSFASDTLLAQFNNVESVQNHFDSYPDDIACLIVEPVAGNMGVVPPADGFLGELRKITERNGALLIFDEVITGFRVAYGGAQERFGIDADITCLGKIIGGGMPVGAYGASSEIMNTVAPLGPMYQAGTLSGNPVAVAAGITTLELLQNSAVYDTLEEKGSLLSSGMQSVFDDAGVALTVNRVGSLMTMFFNSGTVDDWESVSSSDRDMFSKFFHAMLDEGIYLPPSPFEAMFLSTAHSSEDIEHTIDAARKVIRRI